MINNSYDFRSGMPELRLELMERHYKYIRSRMPNKLSDLMEPAIKRFCMQAIPTEEEVSAVSIMASLKKRVSFNPGVLLRDLNYRTQQSTNFECILPLNERVYEEPYCETAINTPTGYLALEEIIIVNENPEEILPSEKHELYEKIAGLFSKKIKDLITFRFEVFTECYNFQVISELMKEDPTLALTGNAPEIVEKNIEYITDLAIECIEFELDNSVNGISLFNIQKLFIRALAPKEDEPNLIVGTSIGRQYYPPFFAQQAKTAIKNLLPEQIELLKKIKELS